MTTAQIDDAWQEVCFIGISKIGGTEVQFAGITETVDFDLGDKDTEGKPLLNGGRMTKFAFEGDSSITFEAYPMFAATTSGTEGKGFFDLLHKSTSTTPVRVINSHDRDKYRVLVLWTNDPNVASAHSSTAENYSGIRIGLAEARFTSVKPSFTDGELKFTVSCKTSAYDKNANGNVLAESCEGQTSSDVLPAIAAYTTSNKWE